MFKYGLILLRQSPQWASICSISELQPEKFDIKVGLSPGTTRRAISLWNQVVPLSYTLLRDRLKKISLDNYRSAASSSLDASNSRTRLSKFRYIHFADDDDWINPQWLSFIPVPTHRSPHFCRWISVKYNGMFEFRANSNAYSFTNSYCLYPRSFSHYSFSQVYQHFDQSAIHNSLPETLTTFVPQPLSITHKHPASINTLRQRLEFANWDPSIIQQDIISYLNKSYANATPEALNWFSPWRSKVLELFESLVS